MRLIITGAAGAGKGTVAKKIQETFNITHVSSGDMFRAEIESNSELGILANSYISKGKLVPDEITVDMVLKRLAHSDCKDGFLLDGFPRTLAQAEALENKLAETGQSTELVIQLEVSFDMLIKRIVGRRLCPSCGAIYNIYFTKPKVDGICDVCGTKLVQRTDDTEKKLEVRWHEHINRTLPVLRYYGMQNKIVVVDANNSPEEVWNDLANKLKGRL